MGITGDRYVGTYEGHVIELVRNNWNKTLSLLIDGEVAATESRILPRDITLTAELEHNGAPHIVVATAMVRGIFSDDAIHVDGEPLPVTKVK